jgi:O-acetyl-ADP-ribose deacetylase (regulator of RNase III)
MSGEGNFLLVATKDHWKDPSRIEWIENILEDMADLLKSAEETMTIALPRIGAGLGGLPWDQVDNLIYYWLSDHEGGDRLDRHTILLYEPS